MGRIFVNLQPAFIAMHSTNQRQRFVNTFHRGNRYFMWLMLFMAMPLMIYRKELISLYVGPNYHGVGNRPCPAPPRLTARIRAYHGRESRQRHGTYPRDHTICHMPSTREPCLDHLPGAQPSTWRSRIRSIDFSCRFVRKPFYRDFP